MKISDFRTDNNNYKYLKDGTTYQDADNILFSYLNFCGCGSNQDEVIALLIKALNLLKEDKSADYNGWTERCKSIGLRRWSAYRLLFLLK